MASARTRGGCETGRSAGASVSHDYALKNLLSFAPAAIAVFDADMRYLAASRRYVVEYHLETKVSGPSALAGQSHDDLFPDLPDEWRHVHRRVLAGETLSARADPFQHEDGRVDWLEWEMAPWRTQAGTIGGAILVSQIVTQRHEAEAALREAEARHRAILDAAPIGVAVIDRATGQLVACNACLGACLGYAPRDFENLHLDHILAEPAPAAALAWNSEAVCDARLRTKTGPLRDMAMRAVPLRLNERDLLCTAFVDVTEWRCQQRQLEVLGNQQAAILDLLPAHMAMLDASGAVTLVNAAWLRFAAECGVSQTEAKSIIGSNYLSVSAAGCAEGAPGAREVYEGLSAMLAGKADKLDVVYPCDMPNGPGRWFRALARPVTTGDRMTGIVVMHIDVTDIVQAKTEVEQREATLASILETLPDAMVISDETGRINAFSSTAERMFGWRADEVLGRNVSMLIPPADRRPHDGYISRYLETGEKKIIGKARVVGGLRKDGSVFPMELSIGEAAIGTMRMFTGFAKDLSELRAAQARLQNLQSELLHVSRLREAGVMASALAHELNQPLTSAIAAQRGARRLLQDAQAAGAQLPAEALAAMDLATEQSLRAGQMIQNLRDFVGRGKSGRRAEDVGAIVRDASALALVGTWQDSIHVTIDVPPALPPVLVDRVQIQQVLFNLMRNAVDAMVGLGVGAAAHEATARRDLLVSAARSGTGMIEIAVADRGPGLAPSIAARLFEAFNSSKPDGMGVGLSICRTIVEAHGGRLWTHPNPGGGTVFRFTLCVDAAPSAKADHPPRRRRAP